MRRRSVPSALGSFGAARKFLRALASDRSASPRTVSARVTCTP
jgi:hypothetical protein